MRLLLVVVVAIQLSGCSIVDTVQNQNRVRVEREIALVESKCDAWYAGDQAGAANCKLQLTATILSGESTTPSTQIGYGAAAQPTPARTPGNNLLCRDAIARGDQGGIMVQCD